MAAHGKLIRRLFFIYVGVLLLTALVVRTATAQSCTPNNNNIFSVSGTNNSTLATMNPQPAGTYTAGVSANMSGVTNSGACFPVMVSALSAIGGGPLTVVQSPSIGANQAPPGPPLNSGSSSGGACVWTVPAVSAGDTVVGFIHSGDQTDLIERYPLSVTDNAGNTYTMTSSLRWDPWNEDIGMWYLTNVQGNPTTFTFQFPGSTPPFAFCNVGFVEYSNATRLETFGPTQVSGATNPVSYTITPSTQSLIWAFTADYGWAVPGSNPPYPPTLQTPGYTQLIDNLQTDSIGVWGSDSLAAAGSPVTLTYNNVATGTCTAIGGTFNGCPVMMMAAAVSATGGTGGTPTITVNGQTAGATVNASATMTVAVINASGSSGSLADRMVICLSGTPSAATCNYGFEYLSGCSTNVPSFPATSGSCSNMVAPSASGAYVVNLYGNTTDFAQVEASAPFTVTGGGVTGACTTSVGGPSPTPCPVGVSPPSGQHWDLTLDTEFTQYSGGNNTAPPGWTIEWNNGFINYDSTNGVSLQANVAADVNGVNNLTRLTEICCGGRDGQRFGYWEWGVKYPSDVSGEGDGYHIDIDMYFFQSSNTFGEIDICEVVLSTGNRTQCNTFTGGYDNGVVWYGYPGAGNPEVWNSPTPIGDSFHALGLYWINDGSANGARQTYWNGTAMTTAVQLQGSEFAVADNTSLYFQSCAGSVWGGGTACDASTSNNNPLQVRYLRRWQLVAN